MFSRHNKEEAKKSLQELIQTFKKNLKFYKSEDYLESNVRSEFIDKFLMIFNWDVNNENNVAPKYKEVIMEAKTMVKGVAKHPDYALCIGGTPVLYVEAKPPSTKILNANDYALQLRKYAYSNKKNLSILTNFEELAVYDTRKSPKEKDEADKLRIKYITFENYIDEFDYLWDTFSYNSVIQGSIDTYFDKTDGNYQINDVNDEILNVINEWRILLIKSIESKKNITPDNVNMAVQRLINRIVFIWRNKGY